MNIKCLFRHHKWRFAYNHGIPLGSAKSVEDTLKMFDLGEAHAVDECTGCGKQSRLVNGKRVILSRNEIEKP